MSDKCLSADFKVTDSDCFVENISDVKIFFGKYDGVQRSDRRVYPITEKLYEVQESLRWSPKELNFQKDRIGYKNLTEGAQEIYNRNIVYQSKADSVASRFLDNVFGNMITSPEWEFVIKTQANFELLHSFSYSYNMRQVYANPEKIFNTYLQDPFIKKRMDLEEDTYNNLSKRMENAKDMGDKKRLVVEAALRQLALESIRFFVSFLYTMKLNKEFDYTLQGSTNNIILIAADETIHVSIFTELLKALKTNPQEQFTHIMNDEWYPTTAKRIMEETIQSELGWYNHLSQFEDIEGMNPTTIEQFLRYYAHKSLTMARVEGVEKVEQNELVRFFEDTRNINRQSTLAQETNQLSYNVNSVEDNGFLEYLEIDPLNKAVTKDYLDKLQDYLSKKD